MRRLYTQYEAFLLTCFSLTLTYVKCDLLNVRVSDLINNNPTIAAVSDLHHALKVFADKTLSPAETATDLSTFILQQFVLNTYISNKELKEYLQQEFQNLNNQLKYIKLKIGNLSDKIDQQAIRTDYLNEIQKLENVWMKYNNFINNPHNDTLNEVKKICLGDYTSSDLVINWFYLRIIQNQQFPYPTSKGMWYKYKLNNYNIVLFWKTKLLDNAFIQNQEQRLVTLFGFMSDLLFLQDFDTTRSDAEMATQLVEKGINYFQLMLVVDGSALLKGSITKIPLEGFLIQYFFRIL
ncbi:unnamed protein product, partial [Didymodactylos carnosus]